MAVTVEPYNQKPREVMRNPQLLLMQTGDVLVYPTFGGRCRNPYFVDQDKQGAARFNPIEISPQGNILNWPDGFFDETMLQEDRITAASLKKRAKKASNG